MKKNLHYPWMLLCACAVSLTAAATPVTPDQALQRAIGQASSSKMKKKPAKGTARLAHTFRATTEQEPTLYVFNKGTGDGYMITPADDRFPALLGYGDNGDFNIDEISPAMKSFIEDYSREIDYAIKNETEDSRTSAIASPGWEPIAPLLKSKWDQGNPYNLCSPPLEVIDATGSPTGQQIPTVTGCVATSMAQVMYYHKWPDVGVGSNSYEWKTYSDVLAKQLKCDFTQMRFDWDNMLDTYSYDQNGNPTWSEAQAKAVADLMYACGISVNMSYNMEQAGGSGAVSRQQSFALVDYFKYSKSIRYKYRDYCPSWEFEEIIYNNLKEGLPVLYNGRGSAGGHSFVCDGYGGDHYFHFNWGWSGVSDGYFYLARLSPQTLGIGGAAGGFNSGQGISYNIRPVKDGVDTGTPELPYFNCVGNFDFDSRAELTAANGSKLMYTNFKVTAPVSGYNAGFWNMSSTPFTGYIGVAVQDKDGKINFVPGLECKALQSNSGTQKIPAYLEKFKEGTYTVYPAFINTVDEESDFIHVVNGYRDHVTMTVDAEGNRTFTDATIEEELATAPELAVTCFSYAGKIYSNNSHDFLMSVANHTSDKDYYGDLTMVIKDSRGRELTKMPIGKYDIPAGLTIPYSFSLTLEVLKKDYIVSFRDSYGRDLPGEYPLSVSETGKALTTQLRIMSFSPTEILPKSTIDNITFQVGNYGTTAITAPQFGIAYYKLGETTGKGWNFQYPNLSIESNRIYNLTLTGLPVDLDEGDYEVRMYYYEPAAAAEGEEPTTKRVTISGPIAVRVGYPVETVTMNEHAIQLKPGETRKLATSLTPDNATFRILTWISSNPAVATVDNKGNVTAADEGHAYISATAYNGANDVCEITVSGSSEISEIEASGARIIAVYSASGIKVLDSPTAEALLGLPAGLYMVQTDKGTYKTVR